MFRYLLLLSLFFNKNIANVEYNNAVKSYSTGDFKSANKQFQSVLPKLSDTISKSNAYFYVANIYFKSEDYLQSIDFYKNTLRLNPKSEAAKYNLILARKKLNEQQNQDKNIPNSSETIEDFFQKIEQLENNTRRNLNKTTTTTGKYHKKNW